MMTIEELKTSLKAKACAAKEAATGIIAKHPWVAVGVVGITSYVFGRRNGTNKGVHSITENYALLDLYETQDGPEVGLYVANENPGQDKYAEALDRFSARGKKWVDCEKVPVRKGQKVKH